MALWTDHITSSHMYFRGLKPDMHAIVILNHRLGKLDPRSTESLTQGGFRGGGGGEAQRQDRPQGQVVHHELTSLEAQFRSSETNVLVVNIN